jgi:hypothetical protein
VYAKAVLACVLTDFIKELADQALLLYKLDIGQGITGQLDGLAKAIFTTCMHT